MEKNTWPPKKIPVNFNEERFLKSPYYSEAVFQVLLPAGTVDEKGCLTVKSKSLTEIIASIQYHYRFNDLTFVIVDIDTIEPRNYHIEDAINFGIFLREFPKPIIVRTDYLSSYHNRLEYYLRYARQPQDSVDLQDFNYPIPTYKENTDWLAAADEARKLLMSRMKAGL